MVNYLNYRVFKLFFLILNYFIINIIKWFNLVERGYLLCDEKVGRRVSKIIVTGNPDVNPDVNPDGNLIDGNLIDGNLIDGNLRDVRA
jgi:hypothetical protein